MQDQVTAPNPLEQFSEEQLLGIYGRSDDDASHRAIEAEMERRWAAADGKAQDAGKRASDPRVAERAEWRDAAHAQFLAAEAECNGYLVRGPHHDFRTDPDRGGKCADCGNATDYPRHRGTDAFALWSGSEGFAHFHATDELRAFWDRNPRLTVTEYQRQAAAGRAEAREAYRSEAMERNAAAGIHPAQARREAVAGGPVRAAGSRHELGRGSRAGGTGIAGGPVQAGTPDRARERDMVPGVPDRVPGAGVRVPVLPGRAMTAADQVASMNAMESAIRARTALRAAESTPAISGTLSPAPDAGSTAGSAVAVREPGSVTWWQPEEQPQPIDGAKLLYHVGQYFGAYCWYPSVAAHVVVVLWNAHAVARERNDEGIGELIWRASPRLGMTSSDNKSGKSTVLDLSRFVQHVRRPVKITGRALAHKIGRKHETLTLDEVKILFGAGAASKDVQGVLLAGYTPGATWEYSSGNKTIEIPCFGPVAYAAKDELITATGDQLVDLFDRTIFIRMQRAPVLMPQIDEEAEDEGRQWGDDLILWTTQVRAQLKARAKELARIDHEASLEAAQAGREIDGRTPQIWRPLIAVADVAGGPWPELARRAMRELTEGAPSAETAKRMADMDQRAARYAPLSFIDAPRETTADDYDDDEEF